MGSRGQGRVCSLPGPSQGSGLQLLSERAVGMQPAETSKCPNGEDIAVRSVTDGTRLVEHPSNVLLRERQQGSVSDRRPQDVQDTVLSSSCS